MGHKHLLLQGLPIVIALACLFLAALRGHARGAKQSRRPSTRAYAPARHIFGGLEPRHAIAVLSISAAALVGIATREGYSDKAYPDPALGKTVPTIGFGTTGPDVKMGDTTTPVKALARTLTDIQKFEGALKNCVRVPLSQNEYDAYVSLAYNIGASAFCSNKDGGPSTLVQRLNAQDYVGACNAILLYDRAGPVNRPEDRCSHPANRTCRGLWRDRLRLQALCLGAQ